MSMVRIPQTSSLADEPCGEIPGWTWSQGWAPGAWRILIKVAFWGEGWGRFRIQADATEIQKFLSILADAHLVRFGEPSCKRPVHIKFETPAGSEKHVARYISHPTRVLPSISSVCIDDRYASTEPYRMI